MAPAIASPTAGAGRKPPMRLGVLFKGNGVHPPSWDIAGTSETDFRLSTLLEPLAPLRDKVLILSNLAHRAGGGSHQGAAVAFLSGSNTPGSIDVPQPVTMDQLAAERLGQHTPLRSLELTADSLFLSQPRCSYISYGIDGKPVRREDDPQTPISADRNPLTIRQLSEIRITHERTPRLECAAIENRRFRSPSVAAQDPVMALLISQQMSVNFPVDTRGRSYSIYLKYYIYEHTKSPQTTRNRPRGGTIFYDS
jgi:hypothetical protein